MEERTGRRYLPEMEQMGMAIRKGGLGKGLDALFVDNAAEESGVVSLLLNEIEPNRDQPRKDFNEASLQELADSIRQHGIIQPLLVRPVAGGGYQLVAGERRWRAARMAGLAEAPVVIREMNDTKMMELALIENLQREDLSPIEEAEGYRMLMEEYGMTQEQTAASVGKSRPAIANAVRLLGLPENIKALLGEGRISAGHARALLSFEDSDEMQMAAQATVSQGLSVRDLEKRAKQAAKGPGKIQSGTGILRRDPIYDEVEIALGDTLGRRVKVYDGKHKGRIEIEFYTREDLMEIANLIGQDEK